jgi:hypothetical protein
MNLIVAVDDNLGMMFNKRRQSKDRVLRERILEVVGENKLYINSYTKKQFDDDNKIVLSESPMDINSNLDYCFIENLDAKEKESNFNKIIVYHWNRVYPKDKTFDIDLSNWELVSEYEFKGNSHDNIKECIYIRKENHNE